MAPRGRMKSAISGLDMYKKVPIDLLEGTRRGSIMSWIALVVMITLFTCETNEFMSSRLEKDLMIDQKENTGDTKLRLNFNITMLDLRCEWLVVDSVSALRIEKNALSTEQNITAHVTKWDLDEDGVRSTFRGRNRNQKDIDLYDETVTESIEELHKDGEDAMPLDRESLAWALDTFDYLFVDFFASWCSHCRDLAPTWEMLAEVMGDHHQKTRGLNSKNETKTEKMDKNNMKNDNDEDDDDSVVDDDRVDSITKDKNFKQVQIAKVDCVENDDVCNKQRIMAYPTLRLFVDGEPWRNLFQKKQGQSMNKPSSLSDYSGHRTVLEMVEWLHFVEQQVQDDESARTLHVAHEAARARLSETAQSEEERKWKDAAIQKKKRHHHDVSSMKESEHPGCNVAGHLLVDRSPGNFHILARSKHHDLIPEMTNVSHMINEFYVGDPTAMHWIKNRRSKNIPTEIEPKITPFDGNVYRAKRLHESYHHYVKLIATKVDGMKVGRRELVAYQMLGNSQLAFYNDSITPEAKFAYDLSPIAVKYSFRSRRWYDYFTSVFAIIGGVFTIVGMLEGIVYRMASREKKWSGNMSTKYINYQPKR